MEVSPPFFEYSLNIFLRFKNRISRFRNERFLSCGSDTSDTVFRGQWRSLEVLGGNGPEVEKCLKPA